MLQLNQKYPIGIEIGDEHIYAAQLKRRRKNIVVRGLMSREIEQTTEQNLRDNQAVLAGLQAVLKSGRFSGKRAVFLIPYHHIASFPIQFKADSQKDIEAAILREAQKHISYPVEEALVDYPSIHLTSTTEERASYSATVIAVRKDVVSDYLYLFKAAGLIPEAIDFSTSALTRLHMNLYGPIKHIVSLCNIGMNRSILSVVDQDRILVRRSITWGMKNIYSKIAANMQFMDTMKKVKALITSCGLVHDSRSPGQTTGQDAAENTFFDRERIVYQIIAPHIDDLIYEFHHMAGYVRSEYPNASLKHIYIYGEGGLIRNLDRYIEKLLSVPTQILNPLQQLSLINDSSLPDRTEGFPFATALGLAMRKVTWL